LVQCLEDAGYSVSTARDGLEAVATLKDLHPDIILVDMEMPRMNGIELTAHVRNDGKHSNIPVIMVTSRSTEKHRRQARAVGVDLYLTKPFKEHSLLQHINEAISVRGAA
jgi:CheY-like chemotaxis protein